jgi:hypothetical protein
VLDSLTSVGSLAVVPARAAFTNHKVSRQDIRRLFMGAGTLLHVPAVQTFRFADSLYYAINKKESLLESAQRATIGRPAPRR